jgi:myo-inositol 2-dehydrogenase/D-chiro-inositol 1-dehydrogenase
VTSLQETKPTREDASGRGDVFPNCSPVGDFVEAASPVKEETMTQADLSRREFLQKTALGASALVLGATGARATAQSVNDDVVLGFIGVGGRGTHLLKTLMDIPGARVTAICDLKDYRVRQGQKIADKFKPAGYADFRRMLEKEKLDGIVVATEIGNHAKCVIPVLEAGLHCFSEKSMDCTVEKVDAIVKAARKAKGIYQIGFQRRYNPGFISAVEKIHGGLIGKITYLQGDWHWPWSVGGWVLDVNMSGGELVEQACHHMDVMSWVMRNQHPLQCVAMGAITASYNDPPIPTSEDKSAVAYTFPGGVIYSYSHLFYLPPHFQDEKLWVFGENAGIDLPGGMYYGRDGKEEQIGEPSGTDWDKGTVHELVGFVDAVRKNDKNLVRSNQETGGLSTLISLMGRMAMYNHDKNSFEPRVVKWEDLGSTSNPHIG